MLVIESQTRWRYLVECESVEELVHGALLLLGLAQLAQLPHEDGLHPAHPSPAHVDLHLPG